MRVPEPNPFFVANRVLGQYKIANRGFETIRANRLNVTKIGFFFFFLRIEFGESMRANRPDSRCEPAGHLRSKQQKFAATLCAQHRVAQQGSHCNDVCVC